MQTENLAILKNCLWQLHREFFSIIMMIYYTKKEKLKNLNMYASDYSERSNHEMRYLHCMGIFWHKVD